MMKALLLLLALTASTSGAWAVTRVNLCTTDRQQPSSPAQVNLARALQIGGLIEFACPQGTRIRMTGEHFISGNTTIDGGDRVTLDAQGSNLFRAVSGGSTLTLRNIRLLNGRPIPGRAAMIWGVMDTVLENVEVVASTKPIQIDFRGIKVTNSRFLNNTGPVLSAQRLSVKDTSFIGTTGRAMLVSSNPAGGEVLLDSVYVQGNGNGRDEPSRFSGCDLTILRSTFTRQVAKASGGGALALDCAKVRIIDSVFEDNAAHSAGAVALGTSASDVEIRGSTFSRNRAATFGGAITSTPLPNPNRSLVILRTRFVENTADRGGAILLDGAQLRGATISFKANKASQQGGAIYASFSVVQLGRTLFVDNDAPAGAGLLMIGDAVQRLELSNSIVARSKGGAGLEGDLAGRVISSTITENSGGGVRTAQQLTLLNSILSNNRALNCTSTGGSGRVIDGGKNLQFPGSSCGDAITVADPQIDNFFVPDFRSLAQRGGDTALCTARPVDSKDFYGQLRPRTPQASCTIGAVEGDIERVIRRTKRRERDR